MPLERPKAMTFAASSDSPDGKKAVFRHLVALYATSDVDALEAYCAPNYVGQTAMGTRDLAEFRKSIINFHAIFDYGQDAFVIEGQFVDGDKVASRKTAHVRMRQTGEDVTMLGINLAIIRGRKIHEEWNTWEILKSPDQDAGAGGAPSRGSLSTWG